MFLAQVVIIYHQGLSLFITSPSNSSPVSQVINYSGPNVHVCTTHSKRVHELILVAVADAGGSSSN